MVSTPLTHHPPRSKAFFCGGLLRLERAGGASAWNVGCQHRGLEESCGELARGALGSTYRQVHFVAVQRRRQGDDHRVRTFGFKLKKTTNHFCFFSNEVPMSPQSREKISETPKKRTRALPGIPWTKPGAAGSRSRDSSAPAASTPAMAGFV